MKLDVNNSGSWKSLMSFNASMESFVREAAPRLMMASSKAPKLRILDDKGDVVAYLDHPAGWRSPFGSPWEHS